MGLVLLCSQAGKFLTIPGIPNNIFLTGRLLGGSERLKFRMNFRLIFSVFLLCIVAGAVHVYAVDIETGSDSGCWFQRDSDPSFPRIKTPADLQVRTIDQYFEIHYPSNDVLFEDKNENDLPDVLDKYSNLIRHSRHLIQTELGWKMPSTRSETGRPILSVYFVSAGRRFSGTTIREPEMRLILNKNVLLSRDFAAIWIHQLAHAAELQYRTAGDYWFYEATAGWMEGQFQSYSAATQKAQIARLTHSATSLNDLSKREALGVSRFLELVARPVRDVIRQVWEQWGYSKDDSPLEIMARVLKLNHLPDLESYLQNYYLLATTGEKLDSHSAEVRIAPFAAGVFDGTPDQSSGGIELAFVPEAAQQYATNILFYNLGEKSGTLSMKKAISEPTSIVVPYTGMERYRLIVVNSTGRELRGTIKRKFDASIPGVLEYFHVNPDEGGVQIEWKTAKENGVAFWNLYRVQGGTRERLNQFPIPASIQSDEGVHYIFLDSSAGAIYSLEAITSEGFTSPLANAETPR